MPNILVIDDDPQFCNLLAKVMHRLGHEAFCAHTLGEGLNLANSTEVDLVFLDVHMPDGNGLELLPSLKQTHAEPEVIIVTGMGDPDAAEMAIKSGAWDYVPKGSSLKDIKLASERALAYRAEAKTAKTPTVLKRDRIVGNAKPMQECYRVLAQAAASEASVLITGETGTGKELFALAIHENSSRREGKFVVVDCAAIPDNLAESMLFGHARGAFTGADHSHQGLVKQADRGTLFLDEVGELPLNLQKAFLRVLQEKRFRPIGEDREVESDFRLVAATNRDLDQLTADGAFRDDLLFRLRTIALEVPPLRERAEDIRDLADFHLHRLCRRYGLEDKAFGSDFMTALEIYPWPGNVRELVNTLEWAVARAGNSTRLFARDLPEDIHINFARHQVKNGAQPESVMAAEFGEGQNLPTLKEAVNREVARVEKAYLDELLTQTGGDISLACDIAGLSRTSLYERLRKYGLTRSRK